MELPLAEGLRDVMTDYEPIFESSNGKWWWYDPLLGGGKMSFATLPYEIYEELPDNSTKAAGCCDYESRDAAIQAYKEAKLKLEHKTKQKLVASEFAWVIERASSLGDAPEYLSIYGCNMSWEVDSLRALRFAREQDAKDFVTFIRLTSPIRLLEMAVGDRYPRICQHGWMSYELEV